MGLRIPFDYKENVKRSVRDLSTERFMSMQTGVHYLAYCKKLYPKDGFDLDLASLLQSEALQTPLQGRYVLRFNVVFEPDSNLYGWLDNNSRLTTNELLNRRRHYFAYDILPHSSGDIDNGDLPQSYRVSRPCHRGSLLNHFGVPAMACDPAIIDGSEFQDPLNGDEDVNATDYTLVADRVLAYLDFARTYLFAQQTISLPYFYWTDDDRGNINIGHISRQHLDDFFIWLRQQKDGVQIGPTQVITQQFSTISQWLSVINRGGHFLAQYEPDMLRNILYDVDTTKVAVSTEGNSFTIDTLRFQNKLQRLVDRYDLSGGRFSSWLRTVWGSNANKRLDIPHFVGTTSVIIDPRTITSVANTYSESTGSGSEVGQMAGNVSQSNFKSNTRNKNFSHYIYTDEPGTLIITVSLVPLVCYSQNIEREVRETLFADDYKPQFAQLGYQDVPWSDYSAVPAMTDGFPTNYDRDFYWSDRKRWNSVVGKQIAWMHLMSDVSRCYGDFDDGGDTQTWVLRRRFTKITSFSAHNLWPTNSTNDTNIYYVDPRDWNYMFLITDGSKDNFYLDFGIDIRAVRPIGKRFMPTLE